MVSQPRPSSFFMRSVPVNFFCSNPRATAPGVAPTVRFCGAPGIECSDVVDSA